MKHAPGDLVVVQPASFGTKCRYDYCGGGRTTPGPYSGRVFVVLSVDPIDEHGRYYEINAEGLNTPGRNGWGCDGCLRKYEPPAEKVGVRREEEALA